MSAFPDVFYAESAAIDKKCPGDLTVSPAESQCDLSFSVSSENETYSSKPLRHCRKYFSPINFTDNFMEMIIR